ncbi:hypothetical protein FQN54_006810 [Arachnomyces sp. PD_36]|nr:hypothetical protein FQN54_006810 [Arachnomyces sp. PD_36]
MSHLFMRSTSLRLSIESDKLHDMPLIILTGYPCSGLTYRANQLSTLLNEAQDSFGPAASSKARYKIQIVTSHDSSHPRTVYDNARSEKEARAVVYGRVKRALGRDTIVIVDGMNYIKGWRYQLWCEAKAVGTTCTVVHVGTPIDQCTSNNDTRLRRREKEGNGDQESNEGDDNEEPYPSELLQNLIYRYEEPTTMSRWDKPLFTVPWSDPKPPIEDIWSALTGTTIPKPTSSTTDTPPTDSSTATTQPTDTPTPTTTSTSTPSLRTLPRPKIKPHQATVLPAATDPTALHALDKRTSSIISTLRTWTFSQPDPSATPDPTGVGITIPIPDVETPIFIPPAASAGASTEELAGAGGLLALPRLQRLRRQWVGMNRAYAARGESGLAAEQVGDAFVRFLNAEFEGVDGDE